MIFSTSFKKVMFLCVTILAVSLSILIISADSVNAQTGMSTMTEVEFDNYLTLQGFDNSYKSALKELHSKYPNWVFIGLNTGLKWSDVASAESKSSVSLMHISMPDAYKSVASGNYNFTTHTYIGKDSSSWVTASLDAVKYFLDPRNFLTETRIFMFEDLAFHPEYQTESVVSKILSTTQLPKDAAGYYIEAANQEYDGKTYSVSPVYLAARTRQEIGSSDFTISGDPFSYGGKNYMMLYNAYNIGATSGSEAAKKGLIYANGGADGTVLSTTFLRPWKTLKQAIMGGALFICQGYIDNNQNTNYLQKFNVDNGLDSVATHQYMTNIMAPYSESSTVFNNYKNYGILDESLTFLIPIYESMPAVACAAPPDTGNNNCYLDSLSVSGYDFTKTFNRFTSTYTLEKKVPAKVSKVNIEAVSSAKDATVKGTGSISLEFGSNKKYVKVTSSTGKVKNYIINIIRDLSDSYRPGTPTEVDAQLSNYRTVRLSWKEVSDADGYVVSYNKTGYNTWFDVEAPTNGLEKLMATSGAKYNFKIRSYVNVNGERRFSEESDIIAIDTLMKISIATSKASATAIRVKWGKIDGTTGYRIYRSTSKTGIYKLVKIVPSTWSSWKDNAKKKGIRYYYKVRAYKVVDDKNIYAPYSGYRSYKL